VAKLPKHQEEPIPPLSDSDRMELCAIGVAREVKIGHHAPRDRAFVRHYDADRREWFTEAVFTWPNGGRVRVDSRTLDIIGIERPTTTTP
jgi:hypothetical protein